MQQEVVMHNWAMEQDDRSWPVICPAADAKVNYRQSIITKCI